jgi:hypothetical protein
MEEVLELSDENSGGNVAARHKWLKNAPNYGMRYDGGGTRPKKGDHIEIFKRFVNDCYERRLFVASTPYVPNNDVAVQQQPQQQQQQQQSKPVVKIDIKKPVAMLRFNRQQLLIYSMLIPTTMLYFQAIIIHKSNSNQWPQQHQIRLDLQPFHRHKI